MDINQYDIKKDNLPVLKAPTVGPKVLQVFLNTDMRYSFDGLTKLAKKHDIEWSKIYPGQYVVFINRKLTMLALFAANGVLVRYRSKNGRLDLRMIQEIPRAFRSSGRIDFDEALSSALMQVLYRRKRLRVDTAIINAKRGPRVQK